MSKTGINLRQQFEQVLNNTPTAASDIDIEDIKKKTIKDNDKQHHLKHTENSNNTYEYSINNDNTEIKKSGSKKKLYIILGTIALIALYYILVVKKKKKAKQNEEKEKEKAKKKDIFDPFASLVNKSGLNNEQQLGQVQMNNTPAYALPQSSKQQLQQQQLQQQQLQHLQQQQYYEMQKQQMQQQMQQQIESNNINDNNLINQPLKTSKPVPNDFVSLT
jgi:hypothetical protein